MKKTIFIAGGGTGGHIYPGIAIAESLKSKDPSIEIHFVGTSLGLESAIIPKEGMPLHLLPIGKLNFKGRYFEKLKTLAKLPFAILRSIQLLWQYKPIFVLGVGGYASGPFVLTAAVLGFNTGLWEPNAIPGLANRWLSRFVDIGFIVFKGSQKYLKCQNLKVLGMPVRSQIDRAKELISNSVSTKSHFVILVFGGSQGARAINNLIFELIQNNPDFLRENKIKFIHQTGKWDWTKAQGIYRNLSDIVESYEFIYDMPKFYRIADLAICRAGASTIAELSAFGLVPILIPLPLADGHQEANARELVDEGAAILCKQNDLKVATLMREILRIKSDAELRSQMSQKLKLLHKSGAADRIAASIFEQVNL